MPVTVIFSKVASFLETPHIYTERHIESAFIIVIVDQGRKKIMAGDFPGNQKKPRDMPLDSAQLGFLKRGWIRTYRYLEYSKI